MTHQTASDARKMDNDMLAFYRSRVAAGSTDPIGDTTAEFGEDASWVANAQPFTYSDGVKSEVEQWVNPTTREQIEQALDNGMLYLAMASGAWWRARRNGRTQTWKTRPTHYRIPVKAGLRTTSAIEHDCNKLNLRIAANRAAAEGKQY